MLLIFDLDDTLVHTHKKSYEKTKYTAELFGHSLTFENFKKRYGKMDFESCVNLWFQNIDAKKFREKYNKIRENFPYEPIGDISNLMSQLSKKHKLGIITNSTHQGTDFKLNCLGFEKNKRDIFNFIFHKHNMKHPKPNPSQIEKICNDGYNKSEIIYFGDNLRDYEFASNAGINFYGVLTGLETKEYFIKNGIKKSHIFKNIHEIKKIFK